MAERMGVRTEVWPLAADEAGIWLLSGDDAWRSGMVDSDSEPHAEVELELMNQGAITGTRFLHSTSWRADGPHVVLTYVAVVDAGEIVAETWRNAKPVTRDLVELVGPPGPGPATSPHAPRYIDVLFHGLRHLRFLLDTDSAARDALDARWERHLQAFTPALAGMYEVDELPGVRTGGLGSLRP